MDLRLKYLAVPNSLVVVWGSSPHGTTVVTSVSGRSQLVSHVSVEHAGLNVAASLDLDKQPILAGLRKSIREGNFGGN